MTDTHPTLMSTHDEWETPQWLFDELNAEFRFKLDPCSRGGNNKCENHFDAAKVDGLEQDWWPYRSVFMNPPYGRAIGHWIEKAYKESLHGCTVVCLIPARTDTKYWHKYCTKGEVRYLEGRLKFRGYSKKHNEVIDDVPATFPSAIVIFRAPQRGKLKRIIRIPRPAHRCPICGKYAFKLVTAWGWLCTNCKATIQPGH